MGSAIKMIALSLPPESTIGLIPLLASLSAVLAGLVGVFFYGLHRVRQSEGLAPGRLEQPYEGPALTWTPSAEPARKLVTHDTLGLGSDLAWLKNRGEIPASLAIKSFSSEPIIALEFAAKVCSTNLFVAAENKARYRRFNAETSAAEKLAALKNPVPAPQPRPASPAPAGVRLRTAVLRAADPLPNGAGAIRAAADQALAVKPAGAAPSESAPARASSQTSAPGTAAPALTTSKTATPSVAPIVAHLAPLAAALAAAKPAQTQAPAIEGKVKDYSFADFLPSAPEPAMSRTADATRK